jgi:hypothetical protein
MTEKDATRTARLMRGLDWLATSGIQRPPGADDAGAVHAWIDGTTREPAYLYSEITGYFVTLCVQLERLLPKLGIETRGAWRERAEAAAAWLVDSAQHASGGILSRKYLGPVDPQRIDPWSFTGGRVAFFDSAMVGFGLVQLWRLTGGQRWLEAARRIGDYLLRAHESADCTRRWAAHDVLADARVPEAERWSQHFAAYELKGAHFLMSLNDATGAGLFVGLAERTLAQALASQRPSGRFPTNQSETATHLHPHTYTIEGLLYLCAAHNRSELLDPAKRALDWTMTTCLLADRPLQQWSELPDQLIEGTRSDALAQSLRAYELIKALDPGVQWAWEGELPTLYDRVCSFETSSGATRYGRDETGDKAHENAWCHFFRMEMELFALARQRSALIRGLDFALV